MTKSRTVGPEGARRSAAPAEVGAADRAGAAPLWPALGLLVLVAAVFGRMASPTYDFLLWDDAQTVWQNVDMNPPTLAGLGAMWTKPQASLYVPVTYSVWWLLATVSTTEVPTELGASLNASVYHLFNIMLHATTAVLVFALLRRLGARDWPAWAGAAVWAVHPLQVEPVGWISGGKDLLWGFFAVLAVWQWVIFAQKDASADAQDRRRRWGHFAVATAAFVLGLLSKPTAMVIPALAAMLDWLIVGRPLRRILLQAAPLLAVSAAWMIVTKIVQPGSGVYVTPIPYRPLIATDALAFYARQIVWPLGLGVDYGQSPQKIIAGGRLWWTWVVPALIALAVLVGRRQVWLVAGALFFVIGVAPLLGLVPFHFQYYSTTADHYLYVSLVGVAMGVTWAVGRARPGVGAAGVGAVLLVLCVLSFRQTGIWQNELTLMHHTATVNPRSNAAFNNIGAYHDAEGQRLLRTGQVAEARAKFEEAVGFYHKALAVRPDSGISYTGLAYTLTRLGQRDAALDAIRKGLRLQVENSDQPRSPKLIPALVELGDMLVRKGEYAEAIEWYRAAERLAPDEPRVREGLQAALAAQEKEQRAP